MVMNMPYSPRLAIFSRSSDSYAQRKDPLDMLPIARSELSECRMACFESPSEYMTQSSTFLPPEWTTQCAMSSLRSRCFASGHYRRHNYRHGSQHRHNRGNNCRNRSNNYCRRCNYNRAFVQRAHSKQHIR